MTILSTMLDLVIRTARFVNHLLAPRPARIDYYEYIKSQAWREKAEAAKKRAGFRCQVCNKHKREAMLNAHHRTYERLGNERQEDITVLCRECHKLFEGHKQGAARSAGLGETP